MGDQGGGKNRGGVSEATDPFLLAACELTLDFARSLSPLSLVIRAVVYLMFSRLRIQRAITNLFKSLISAAACAVDFDGASAVDKSIDNGREPGQIVRKRRRGQRYRSVCWHGYRRDRELKLHGSCAMRWTMERCGMEREAEKLAVEEGVREMERTEVKRERCCE